MRKPTNPAPYPPLASLAPQPTPCDIDPWEIALYVLPSLIQSGIAYTTAIETAFNIADRFIAEVAKKAR